MATKFQRITLNFFLDTDQELDISQISETFKKSSDYQHNNLNVYPDGEFAISILWILKIMLTVESQLNNFSVLF